VRLLFAFLVLLFFALAYLIGSSPGVARGGRGGWSSTAASAYSAASTGSTRQGCPGAPPLRDSARSVATFLVACGARLRICYAGRCVTASRTDSGPFTGGRGIDLNLGAVRALGFSSCQAWGVRPVRWRRL
jgi:hypothetical protein